jgi:K+-transporting ATPase ATPase C chain
VNQADGGSSTFLSCFSDRLSDTQVIILSAAAQRSEGNLLPLPGSLRGGAAAYRAENGANRVPVDAATASGSGLDPHISLANAEAQSARVAAARGVPAERVAEVVAREAEGRWLGVFGTSRVNVLVLNLALDAAFPLPPAAPEG